MLLAELTKRENVPCSAIITGFFFPAQDCCLLSGVQSEGEAEDEDSIPLVSYMLNKVNLHPHCCKNLNSCTGEILPVHAVKAYGVLEKV